MPGLTARMSVPLTASALAASPATSGERTPLVPVEALTSSREGNGDPNARRAETLSTAETDKLLAEVLARHTQSFEAADAFDDLNHGLLLAREKGEQVPCVGPGAEAWTSEEATDQELAADLCLLCPVFALCQRYADVAKPKAGTWAGVTRDKARTVSPEWIARKARSAARRERRELRELRKRRGESVGTRRWNPGARDCTCGCGGRTKGGFYLPGHDSTHLVALVTGVRAGALEPEEALAEVAHSEKLQAKLAARVRH